MQSTLPSTASPRVASMITSPEALPATPWDERWLVPHFEKMLYDNGLLLDLMIEVWRERQSPILAARIAETADWALREMVADGGGFAASYDADSEGEEGKFCVWTPEDVSAVLGPDGR